jgi:hypothetical protein
MSDTEDLLVYVERVTTLIRQCGDELSLEQWHQRQEGFPHTLAFCLWHTISTLDLCLHRIVFDAQPVYLCGDWEAQLPLPREVLLFSGIDWSEEQIQTFRLNPERFLRYSTAVQDDVQAAVEICSAAELEEVVEWPLASPEFPTLARQTRRAWLRYLSNSHLAPQLEEAGWIRDWLQIHEPAARALRPGSRPGIAAGGPRASKDTLVP